MLFCFFPILELIYYVSFYLHNHINNFRFVPKLTFFRTYQVQIYNIEKEITTFLRVISINSSKIILFSAFPDSYAGLLV